MNDGYNVWCKWHPLRTVMLGDCYRPNFFAEVKSDRIRSALTRITEETMEDLDGYEQVLKSFGCKVIRPQIIEDDSITNYANVNGQVIGNQGIPRQPLQPRDCQLVIGNKLYFTGLDAKIIRQALLDYNKRDIDIIDFINDPAAPSYTLVGKDIYVDLLRSDSQRDISVNLSKLGSDFRINYLKIGGHNDGCFHTLKPGAILSLINIQRYADTFPTWDVCYLENQSWSKIDGFWQMKDKVRGKWWVPGEEGNDEFTHFVETWLQDWVGYCEESVFDVNVLMLDEKHVCVNNYNETAFAFFKKHHIEPIIVPWRHRYFWDGGLHCITLDLYREGEMEDYFPSRMRPITDEGCD